jgi:hypothetical protein
VVADKEGEVVVVDLNHSRPLKAGLRRRMLDEAMETEDMDNEAFLMKMKQRLDAYGPIGSLPCCNQGKSSNSATYTCIVYVVTFILGHEFTLYMWRSVICVGDVVQSSVLVHACTFFALGSLTRLAEPRFMCLCGNV